MNSTSQALLPLTSSAGDSPVSPFPTPGSEKAKRMTATSGRECLRQSRLSGPLGFLLKMLMESDQWSSSEHLLKWSAEPLPAVRTVTISTLYSHNKKSCSLIKYAKKSKKRVTKSNRLLFRLAPLIHRKSEPVFSSWPTPKASAGGPDFAKVERSPKSGLSLPTVAVWSTPIASDGEKGGPNMRYSNGTLGLPAQAAKAVWATPTVSGNGNRKGSSQKAGDGLSTQAKEAHLTSGRTTEPSTASTTTKSDAPPPLNPEFVCWLMGFPEGWAKSVGSATQSAPSSPTK